MKDGIIKGSGNSRFLKSVGNFKTLYPTYDAFASALVAGTLPIDFNGINAAGWEQIGDAMAKYSLLKDSTAEALGLNEAALPDDALSVLSRFHAGLANEYVWAKITTSSGIVLGNQITTHINKGAAIQYSATVDFSSGTAKLVNPNTTYPQTSNVAELLEGMYYALPDNAVGVYKFVSIVAGSSSADVTGNLVSYSTAQEVVGYVNSPDPNSYPPDGNDGYTYLALGMLGGKANITTGSYNGTGASGSGNANSLTFDFAPRIIILTHAYYNVDEINGGGWWDLINRGFAYGTSGKNTQIIINADTLTTSYKSGLGFAVEGSYTPSAKKSADGKTITWYGSNAASQANQSSFIYYYIAIG